MSKQGRILTLTRKDFDIQTFKSGGKGGQHQNKTDSGVRIVHRSSGARGESRNDRSQHVNKKLAFKRLVESSEFKLWLNRTVAEIANGKTIDERVDEQMQMEFIQVEHKDSNGKWVRHEGESFTG